MDQRPRFDTAWKPDFTAPTPKLAVSEAMNVFELLDFEPNSTVNPLDAYGALDQTDKPVRYYQSQKVLGILFRQINERQFYLKHKKETSRPTNLNRSAVLKRALAFVLRHSAVNHSKHREAARDIRHTYENVVNNTRYTFAIRQSDPLIEIEVITGQILGSNTRQNKEESRAMRDSLSRDLAYVKDLIIKGTDNYTSGDETTGDGQALPRSIACFQLAMEDESKIERHDHICSWKYFAAAVCLRELANSYGQGSLVALQLSDDVRN
jgi:hypothetical protein